MATLKWKNDDHWETFFYGAFENIKADLKNIIKAINNSAAAIRMRCRRDKNLSDVYSAEDSRWNLGFQGNDHSNEAGKMGKSWHHHDDHHLVISKNLSDVANKSDGRKNLQLINDCSDSSRLGSTTHHHDSRYLPYIGDIWGSDGISTPHDITNIWKKLAELEDSIEEMEEDIDNNMAVTLTNQSVVIWDVFTGTTYTDSTSPGNGNNRAAVQWSALRSDKGSGGVNVGGDFYFVMSLNLPQGTHHISITDVLFLPIGFNDSGTGEDTMNASWNISTAQADITNVTTKMGYHNANDDINYLYGHIGYEFDYTGTRLDFEIRGTGHISLHNFDKNLVKNAGASLEQVEGVYKTCQAHGNNGTSPAYWNGINNFCKNTIRIS